MLFSYFYLAAFNIFVDYKKPWPKLVHYFVEKMTIICSRSVLFALGFYNIKYEGKRDHSVRTVISNHTSYVDILVVCTLEVHSFVFKEFVKKIPLWGYFAVASNSVTISKTDKGTTPKILEFQKTRQECPLLLFPEATTSNGCSIIKFKTGAFINGLPVQPVLIRYIWSKFSPTWESIPPFSHLFGLITQFSYGCVVKYLPPYYPNEMEKQNPQLYADNVQKVMANALGVPAVPYVYEDKKKYQSKIISKELSWKYYLNK